MGDKRILCIGTDDPRTRPWPKGGENSREYLYPPPGKLYSYGAERITRLEANLPKHSYVPAIPGGPAIQGFGILLLGDAYTRIQKPPIESSGSQDALTQLVMGVEKPEFETRIISGEELARDIFTFWSDPEGWDYGVRILADDWPTEEELEVARANRKRSALNYLNAEIRRQNLAAQGRGEAKLGFTRTDEAWAREFGVILPATVDSLARIEPQAVLEDTPCPECMLNIAAQARRCRHCGTNFKMPVMDYLTKPEPVRVG